MKKQVLLLFILTLVIAGVVDIPSQAATTVTVKPSSMNGWYIAEENQSAGAGSFVSGPAPVPLGSGSAELVVDSTGRVILATTAYAGTPLDQITSLQYHAYRSTPDAGNNLAISLQFDVNFDARGGGHANEGRLVYEPYKQSGWGGNINEDTWYSWTPLSGRWWATRSPGSDSCPQSSPCDWETVKSLFPFAAIRTSSGNVLFKAGGPWDGGFTGSVDDFTIGIAGEDTSYDFEPETNCTADCYVNAASGNDAFGGDTPASAKQTIQAGIEAVDPGGTVHVAAGVYPEQLLVVKSLHLVGEDGSEQTLIQAPAGIPPASDPASAVVNITGASVEAELTGFTVRGPGPSTCGSLAYGVFVRAGATADIHDNSLLDIRDEPFSGCQNGVAIQVGRAALDTTGTATIQNNLIAGYQKNGVTVSNAGSSAVISGNILTGAGPNATIAQNGIQVSDGATAEINANSISNHSYTPGEYTAAGILLYNADAGTSANTLEENQTGLYHLEGSGTHDGNIISASAAGTGVPAFWGMVIAAPPPGLAPDPLEASRLPDQNGSEASDQLPGLLPLAGPLQTAVVTNNEFSSDGGIAGVGLGAYAGYAAPDISLSARNNTFTGWGQAIEIDQCSGTCTGAAFSQVEATLNSFSGNTEYGLYNGAAVAAQAEKNWWASPSGPAHAGNPGGTGEAASDAVDYEPWLCDGADTDPATGFQPDEDLVCGGTPPETSIDAAPAALTNDPSAGFTFSATDDFTPSQALIIECQLDGLGWGSCTSPASLADLADGSHTFQARASDPAGSTDLTPASHTWTIDTQGPAALDLSVAPNPAPAGSQVSLTVTLDDGGLGGQTIVSAEFSLDGGSWSLLAAKDSAFNQAVEVASGGFTAPDQPGEFEVCARGRDAAGNDGVPACTTLTTNPGDGSPPFANAGGPYSGVEAQPVKLTGSAGDPDGDPLSVAWSYQGKSGFKPGTTCSFGSKNALQTTFTCNDNGTFVLTLTVSDGKHPPVSAKTTVKIANQPPEVKILKPAQDSSFQIGAPVELKASFLESAANDTVACLIDWGVRLAPLSNVIAGNCQGNFTYAKPGSYTIRVTTQDDDGGLGDATVTILVTKPVEEGNLVFMPVVIR